MYDKRDTLAELAERAISVRLDADAAAALQVLTSGGQSQSEAIRVALLTAARKQLRDQLAKEAAALADDEADRVVVADVQEFMETLSASW
jgi:Arc/MetJ-type ribon-helix-helix transcriptional regulator